MLPSLENLEENLQQKLSAEEDKQDTKEEKPSQEHQTPQGRTISPLRSGVHEHMTLK